MKAARIFETVLYAEDLTAAEEFYRDAPVSYTHLTLRTIYSV